MTADQPAPAGGAAEGGAVPGDLAVTVTNSGNATATGGGEAISGAQATSGAGPVHVSRTGDARAESPGSVAISGAVSLTVEQPLPTSPYQVRTSLDDDTAGFTGRHEEVQAFLNLIERSGGQGGVFTIHGGVQAIDGMPGVGKTALAVHLAHLVKDRFTDRQLQVNLHGHTPDQDPVPPFEALGVLLTATGMDARYLPATLEERAGHWRDRMNGQRALLVLDNARDSRQVRPLLPESRTCLVLVTSRHHLGELKSGICPIALDVLPEPEARELFIRLAPCAVTEPGTAVDRIVTLAGRLPLAIALLAELYASSGGASLTAMIEDVKDRLLTVTPEITTLAVAFGLSFDALQEPQQQFFAHLGLHPGTEIDKYAAAALTGVPVPAAAGLLQSLHQASLVTRPKATWGRYGMHDLIRAYTQHRAATLPAADLEQALGQLLDYYQHTATLAQGRLARQPRPGPSPAAPAPSAAPVLQDAGQALEWARTERDSLLACLDHVTRVGLHTRVIALTAALAELLRRDGPWKDAITRHTTAVQSARHLGDRLGQAGALNDLGTVRQLRGDLRGAAGDLEQALVIYCDLGDQLGQANAHSNLGIVRRLTSDLRGAAGDLEQALVIYRDLGDQLGQATVLTFLGDVRRLTGDYPGAVGDFEQTLAIDRDIGHRLGQANALSFLGDVRRETGDFRGAAGDLEQALAICRDISDRLGQANALTYLGTVRRGAGDYPGAAGHLEQALAIYRDLGDRLGQAEVLNEAGTLHRVSGEPANAEACHRQALELARAISSAPHEARALAGLGRCAATVGHTTRATALLRQAHEMLQQIGAADAPSILAELDALTSHDPHDKP